MFIFVGYTTFSEIGHFFGRLPKYLHLRDKKPIVVHVILAVRFNENLQ